MRALLGPSNHLLVLARSGRRLPHPVLAVPLAIVMMLIGGLTGEAIVQAIRGVVPALTYEISLIALFLPIYFLLWAWLLAFEKRGLRTLGFEPGGVAGKIARGAASGASMLAATVGLMALLGGIVWAGSQEVTSGLAALGFVLAALAGYVVQGTAEEVVFRGWLLPVVGARTRPWLGIVVSAVLFAVVHSLNPGIGPLAAINLVLVGVFLALWALAEGGLWGVSAWHALWNWTQGPVFGLSVSGLENGPRLVDLENTGLPLISGGAFGPEGSVACTVVLIAGTVGLMLLVNRCASTVPATP